MNSLGVTNAFEELMLLNCGVGEDFGESLGQQGEPTIHPKGNQSWIFMGRTDVEAETPILWPPYVKNWLIRKRPWCWGRLKAGEGDKRGWDGWMASPTQQTWVWINSRSWWRTGRPGLLQSMRLQRVGHRWATELTDWTDVPTTNSTTPPAAVSYSLSALPTHRYPWNV